MGDHTAAIDDYSATIAVDPANSYAFYNRGIARDHLGDLEGAIADFTAAAALNPGNADFYHNRGFSQRKLVRLLYSYRAVLVAWQAWSCLYAGR